ncbi:MAG: TlpA family protein disulfide reductase [Gammaproteobacteria bacterium]|nr:TlpA family protein disulfide reductase [Gammaproteobacteria bacterium]
MLIVTGLYPLKVQADVMVELQQQLAEAKGQVVYVDFWASWCKPCRHSFPWMNEMKAKYQDQGLKVITINLDKEKQLAEKFLDENPAAFDVIYDPDGITAKQFQLKGMPMSFTIDRMGRPFNSHVGFNEKKQDEYEQELIQLLSKSKSQESVK